MKHLKRYNESSKLDFQDLVYLFVDMIDEYRNISIQTGNYFKSKHYMLKDLVSQPHESEAKQVIYYLEKNKPFFLSIQLHSGDKRLTDSIHILSWVKENETQIEYYGYKLKNFFISREDILQLEYEPIESSE
jgi:hypothetical protein